MLPPPELASFLHAMKVVVVEANDVDDDDGVTDAGDMAAKVWPIWVVVVAGKADESVVRALV